MKDIRIILRGGLGNQILLIAAAYSFAQRFGCKLIVNLEWFNWRQRSSSLKKFRRDIEFTKLFAFEDDDLDLEAKTITSIAWFWLANLCRALRLFTGLKTPFNLVHVDIGYLDPTLRPESTALTSPHASYIGYYQHLVYLQPARSWLRSRLDYSRTLTLAERLYKDFSCTDDIRSLHMLHIRREDSMVKGNNHYGILSSEYYKRVIESSGINKKKIVVFSDDYQWASSLEYLRDSMVIDESSPVATLLLMIQFNNYIIANSTLSWCAAWLSDAARPIVHYPYPFFESVDPYFATSMIPDWWTSHPSSFFHP